MELMELLEELVEEILLRIPLDEPAYLVRARLVCKSWFRILSDRSFLRRYRVPPNAALARLLPQPLLPSWPDPSVCPDDIHGLPLLRAGAW